MQRQVAKKEPKPKPTKLKTQAAIARHKGVHARTVADWIAAGLPKPPIDVAVLEAWCAANRRGDKLLVRNPDPEKAAFQLRKLKAETNLVEMKEALARRDLLPIDEVLSCLLPYLTTAKVVLEGVPDRLLPYLSDPATFRRKAAEAIKDVLAQLADAARELERLKDGPPSPA